MWLEPEQSRDIFFMLTLIKILTVTAVTPYVDPCVCPMVAGDGGVGLTSYCANYSSTHSELSINGVKKNLANIHFCIKYIR